MSEKDINKKETVLAYALENHFSDWLIKEIRERKEDSNAIQLTYESIEKDNFYPIKANDVYFYLE